MTPASHPRSDRLPASRTAALPRARRRDLVVFAAVLLGPAAIVLAGLAAGQDVAALEEALARDAEAALTRPHPRPVHVDAPVPGNVGDAYAAHLPALHALSRELAGYDALRAVAAGDAPLTALTAEQRATLARIAPALDGLLAGTHAVTADLSPVATPFVPAEGTSWTAIQLAGVLAGIRVREALEAGRPDEAAATCLDALALARDASLVGGLIGRMTGAAVVARLLPPCGAAVATVSPARGAALLPRLRTIRDALPPPSEMLRDEFVASSLFVYAPVLGDRFRARLGPRALAMLKEGERTTAAWERALLRYGWRAMDRHRRNLVEAAARPPLEREAAFLAAEKAVTHWLNPLVHLEPSYLRYLRRDEAAARRQDALVLAAAARAFRAERGTWPPDPAALREAGLVTALEHARSGSARFEPAAGGGLRLVVPLPRADPERDPAEVALALQASAR